MGLITSLIGMQQQFASRRAEQYRFQVEQDAKAKEGMIQVLKEKMNPANNPTDAEKAWAWQSIQTLTGDLLGQPGKGGGGGGSGIGGAGGGSGGGKSGGGGGGKKGAGADIGNVIRQGILGGAQKLLFGPSNKPAHQRQQGEFEQISKSEPQKQFLSEDPGKKSLSNPYGLSEVQQRDTKRAEAEAKVKLAIDARIAEQHRREGLKAEFDNWQQIFDFERKQGTDPARAKQIADEAVLKVKESQPQTTSTEKLTFTGPKGEELVLFRDPATRKMYNLAGREVPDPTAQGYKIKEGGAGGAGGDSGAELKEREAIDKILADPNADPIKKQAARETKKHLDAVSSGAGIRVVIGDLTAKDKREQENAPDDIVKGIIRGTIPPDRTGLSRNSAWLKIAAKLEKAGFDLTKATLEWDAAKKDIAALNSSQQLRMRQAAGTIQQLIPDLRSRFDAWKKTGLPTGFRAFNAAALKAAANLPGESGEAARALQSEIATATAELAFLYQGGNSPTKESFEQAGKSLQSDWNELQFNGALRQLGDNVRYRVNAINTADAAGISPDSPYQPYSPPQAGTTGANGAAKSNDPLGIR